MSNDRQAIPRQPAPHGSFNEHRNTSRVWPVPPGAADEAIAALKRLPKDLRAWITSGHPTLSQAEHLALFGRPYDDKQTMADQPSLPMKEEVALWTEN